MLPAPRAPAAATARTPPPPAAALLYAAGPDPTASPTGPRPLPRELRRRQSQARPASRRWEGAGRTGATHVNEANPGWGRGGLGRALG